MLNIENNDFNNQENNDIFEEVDNNSEKKKRGRKKKEDILKKAREEEERKAALEKKVETINPEYYQERNEYNNILLTAFITRLRNINSNNIKDNDNIIVDSAKILNEVKNMKDEEYGNYYKMWLRNINGEDIFDNNDYFL